VYVSRDMASSVPNKSEGVDVAEVRVEDGDAVEEVDDSNNGNDDDGDEEDEEDAVTGDR